MTVQTATARVAPSGAVVVARRGLLDSGTLRAVPTNVLLAALYFQFAWLHVAYAERTGDWASVMPVVAQEALLVLLFFTRRRSLATSSRPIDWAVGIVGTFLPLFMRATNGGGALAVLGTALQTVALLVAVGGVASLGRSVGVVAADRGVKTGGLYRRVRHPMYAAYIASYVGYLAAHPSARNALVVVATILALNARALAEERFLARNPRYRAYLHTLPWRFLPQVY